MISLDGTLRLGGRGSWGLKACRVGEPGSSSTPQGSRILPNLGFGYRNDHRAEYLIFRQSFKFPSISTHQSIMWQYHRSFEALIVGSPSQGGPVPPNFFLTSLLAENLGPSAPHSYEIVIGTKWLTMIYGNHHLAADMQVRVFSALNVYQIGTASS